MTNTTITPWILALSLTLTLIACGGGGPDGECISGELGCTCLPADTCGTGLACVDQQCQAPSELGFSVSDGDARSCEVLLNEGTVQIVGATFGEKVTGVHLRQGDHSAVSFFANSDGPIADGAMALQVVEGPTGSTSDIAVKTATCFDRDGRELANATVNLRR